MFESSVMVAARMRWISVTVHLDVFSYSAGGCPLVDVLSYSSAVGCPQLQLTVQVDVPRWMSSITVKVDILRWMSAVTVQVDVLSYSAGGRPLVDALSYSSTVGCPQLQLTVQVDVPRWMSSVTVV